MQVLNLEKQQFFIEEGSILFSVETLPSRRHQSSATSCWYPWNTNSTCAHAEISQHSWSHELTYQNLHAAGSCTTHTTYLWEVREGESFDGASAAHHPQKTTAVPQEHHSTFARRCGLRKQKHQATIALKSTATFSPTSRFKITQQPHWRLQDAVPFWEPSLNLLPAVCASGATDWLALQRQAVVCGFTRLTDTTLQDTQSSAPL